VRLRRALVEQRTAWLQRIRAQPFHHGHPARRELLVRERRAWLEGLELPHAARTQVEVALGQVDHLHVQLEPLDRELRQIASCWPGRLAIRRQAARDCALAGAEPARGVVSTYLISLMRSVNFQPSGVRW
jgi:transposase